VEELVRQQQAAALGGIVVDERVLGHPIVDAFVVLDAEGAEIVAERQQPMVRAVVADDAEDRPLLEDDPLVDLDARRRELQLPLAVRDRVDDVLTDRRTGRLQRDAPQVLAEQHRVIVEHLERRRRVVDRIAVDGGDVERSAVLPPRGGAQRRGDGD
jgi:hypothetical protein